MNGCSRPSLKANEHTLCAETVKKGYSGMAQIAAQGKEPFIAPCAERQISQCARPGLDTIRSPHHQPQEPLFDSIDLTRRTGRPYQFRPLRMIDRVRRWEAHPAPEDEANTPVHEKEEPPCDWRIVPGAVGNPERKREFSGISHFNGIFLPFNGASTQQSPPHLKLRRAVTIFRSRSRVPV